MKFIHFTWLVLLALFSNSVLSAPNVSVTFVLDESGSVSQSNFQLETNGFINALNSLPTDGSVEISVVGFSSSTQTVKSLTTLTSATLDTVKSALQSNPKNSGGTNMSAAINVAAGLLNSSTATTKVICLATDGAPNNATSTRNAANSAKGSGITLSPIGIGLDSSGKTFLDSIASNPPTPAPSNFTEFSTVVTNSCVGVVKSALNIQLTPDPVDFGKFTASDQVCNAKKTIGVSNGSDQPAIIKDVQITGSDAGDFKLLNVLGVEVSKLTPPYQTTLPPFFATFVEVELIPNQTPADASYDAELTVIADDNGREVKFTTQLVGKIDPTVEGSCLEVKVIDASPTIASIVTNEDGPFTPRYPDGTPLLANNNAVGITDVITASQQQSEMKGLVADGNARLILDALVPGVTSGKVRFQIPQPSQTGATLYKLDKAPTYAADGSYDANGFVTLDVDILTDPDGNGRAIAILRAGERFGGVASQANIEFTVNICTLDSNDECESGRDPVFKTLKEERAPVVLIHGLWANPSSWGKIPLYTEDDDPEGLFEQLRDLGFPVSVADYCEGQDASCRDSYPDYKGPSEIMTENVTWLSNYIKKLCTAYKKSQISCTRADLVGHSMGGLMSRSYINLNKNHSILDNYKQGSIRRLITLSTPHTGSGLANLLRKNEADINNCIREEEKVLIASIDIKVKGITLYTTPEYKATGEEVIDLIIRGMEEPIEVFGRVIVDLKKQVTNATAIDDLVLNNPFVAKKLSTPIDVPVFAIFGDIGNDKIGLDLEKYGRFIPGDNANTSADELLENITGCHIADLFNNRNSDGIVPTDSSRWESYITNDMNRQKVNHQHTGMGTNAGIINLVVEKLNSPLSDYFVKQ